MYPICRPLTVPSSPRRLYVSRPIPFWSAPRTLTMCRPVLGLCCTGGPPG